MIQYLLLILIFVSVSCRRIPEVPHYPLPDVSGRHGPRIVGGIAAKLGEFIGQVSLQNYFRSHVCGGTLIDPVHVVTAAHCLQYRNPIVYVMGDDLYVSRNGTTTRQLKIVEHFIVHELYDPEKLHNDIAIIRLDSPFRTSINFRPIDRSINRPAVGQNCTVVGWGYTSDQDEDGKEVSINLLKVNVEVVDLNFCNNSYDGLLTSQSFCAGAPKEGGRDSCQGDSGGLLTCDPIYKSLTGIVSFGYSCGLAEYAGVYTDVQQFNPWIDTMLKRKSLPPYPLALPGTTEVPQTTTDTITASIAEQPTVTTDKSIQPNTTKAPSSGNQIHSFVFHSILIGVVAVLKFI